MGRIFKIIAPPAITAEQRADIEKRVNDFYKANSGVRRTDNLALADVGPKGSKITVVGTYRHHGLERTVSYTVTRFTRAETITKPVPKGKKAVKAEKILRTTEVPTADGRAAKPAMKVRERELIQDRRARTPQAIRQERILRAKGPVSLPNPDLAEAEAAPADKPETKASKAPATLPGKNKPEERLEAMLKSRAVKKSGSYYTVAGGDKFQGRKAILKAIRAGKV